MRLSKALSEIVSDDPKYYISVISFAITLIVIAILLLFIFYTNHQNTAQIHNLCITDLEETIEYNDFIDHECNN